mgnify:CR=1 FL=1
MKRLYAFPLFLGLMLMNSTLMAQQENAFMKIDYSTGTANAIAPDGKWVVGGRAGEAFIYNTEATSGLDRNRYDNQCQCS